MGGGYNFPDFAFDDGTGRWCLSTTTPRLHYRLDRVEPGRWAPLVVVFSEVGAPEGARLDAARVLRGVPANLLIIMDDFSGTGIERLNNDGDRGGAGAVQTLLREAADQLGVSREAVMVAGWRGAGAAALHHGLAFGAGGIVVGEPPSTGGSARSEQYERTAETTRIDRFGDGDADAFGVFLRVRAAAHVEGALASTAIPADGTAAALAADGQAGRLRLAFTGMSGLHVSVKLFRGADVVDTLPYKARRAHEWASLSPGGYRARVYYRPRGGSAQAITTSWCRVA